MCGFRSNLVCFSVLSYKAIAYYKICPLVVHYESVMFYITGPRLDSLARSKHSSLLLLNIGDKEKNSL
jgi:hypothetical protein